MEGLECVAISDIPFHCATQQNSREENQTRERFKARRPTIPLSLHPGNRCIAKGAGPHNTRWNTHPATWKICQAAAVSVRRRRLIFLNPEKQEVEALLQILTNFGMATGLRLNLSKCSVAPIRCAGLNLDRILESFTGQRVSFPITYLGLPLTLGRMKIVHLQTIVDKAKGRLAGWQGQLLNPAGRRELVQSVLNAIPVYLLTSIQAPKQLFEDLDKLRRRFLWAGDSEISGGKCKVGWPLVSSHKTSSVWGPGHS